MKLILTTLGVSLVLAIAGCQNTNNTNASLGAAEDTPACCGSAACAAKAEKANCDAAKKAENKASLGAADNAPANCASSCSAACKAKCDAAKKAETKDSSLGAFDDAAKTKASCCPGGAAKKTGSCPFSGKKN